MRRYLGLGKDQEQLDYSPVGRVVPLLVPAVILLVTYEVLERPWWQELLVGTAGIFVAGIVVGLWPTRSSVSDLDVIEYRLRANSRGSMAVAPVLVIIGTWAQIRSAASRQATSCD